MNKYNLALTCTDKEQGKLLKRTSQDLNNNVNSLYTLGINSLPHVTIAQFHCEKDSFENLQKRYNDFDLDQEYSLEIDDFYINTTPSSTGGYYYGFSIVITSEIRALEQSVLNNILKPDQATSAIGEFFFPHFTLGVTKDIDQLYLTAVTNFIRDNEGRSFNTKLSLGLCESRGRFLSRD